MKKKKITTFFLVGMINIVLLFYMSISLERVIYEELNDYDFELEVTMSEDEYKTFTKYAEDENVDVEFSAFRNNVYTLFTSNNINTGCYEQNNFGYINQYIECELEQNDNSRLKIRYTNKQSYKQTLYFLDTNNIQYEEEVVHNYLGDSIYDYFIVAAIIILLLMIYLSNFNNLDEVVMKYLNGWSRKRIILESYIGYLINFIVMGAIISLISIVLLKFNFSDLSYKLFVENILHEYLFTLIAVNLIVILLITVSVYNLLYIKRNNRNSYQKIVVSYVMKTALYVTTIAITSVCFMQIVNLNIDKNNLSEYEKFDDYSGYQLTEDQLANTLEKNNDYVYYTSLSPSVLDEAYEKYCKEDFKNIVYCKAIIGSSKFFEITSNNKFEKNTLVISNKYKKYENEIVQDIKTEYKGLDFDVVFIENTNIYSFLYNYSNDTKDYIEDAIWLVFADYHETLYNVDTIYSIEPMGEDVYKIDNFSSEYREYLGYVKNQIATLFILSILQVILFIFLNSIIIRSTINNKLQIVATQITNGFSYYDIFYIHYSHIIIISIVSTIASSYVLKDLIPFTVPLVVGIIVLAWEIVLNDFLIRVIVRSKIAKYLKGDKL